MEYKIQTENFMIDLKPKNFDNDILLEVTIQSDGFSANTEMDIKVNDFAKFAIELNKIYENLSGEARIQEEYGMNMYLSFSANNKGYILVQGYLHKSNKNGKEQILKFENEIEQTYFKNFSYNLYNSYGNLL